MKRIMLFIAASSAVFTISTSAKDSYPAWVKTHIQRLHKGPLGNPAHSIWQYQYRGKTVYYVPPQCCDIPSALYDAKQKRICSPDGGMTGAGDGKCADFYQTRKAEKRIWQDSRQR